MNLLLANASRDRRVRLWSNPFCHPDMLPCWNLNREELPEVLAERFMLPLETIQELLEYITEEELFDGLAEMEDAGTLAAECEKLSRVPQPAQ